MAIDFPSSPANGQQFTAGNVTWIWDGVKWGVPTTASPSIYLPLTGGAMTGPITLAADPTLPMHDVTKRYADSLVNDNRVINGDFRIDQRNNGATGTAAGLTIDRWKFNSNLATKGTWGRNLNAVAGPTGFPYYFGFQSNSAYAVASGDFFGFVQAIEADAVSDFAWGTANAQPVTLSFWAQSNLPGAFGGSLTNVATNRSYPFSYSIPTANTWTKIIVAIPGDTTGTWAMSGNGVGVALNLDLGTGATYRGPANAWAGANYVGSIGAVSIVGTQYGLLYVTGVKLEIGSVATPYNRQSLAKSMADCQRYYQTISVSLRTYTPVVSPQAHTLAWLSMRALPTITLLTAGTRGNVTTITPAADLPNSGYLSIGSTTTGDTYVLLERYSLSAEL